MADVLEEVSWPDLVRSVILLKPGREQFKEEALYYGFKKFSEQEPRYRALLIPSGNETSSESRTTESSTRLERIVLFLKQAYHLQETEDWQYVFLTPKGRIYTAQFLTGTYSDNIRGAIQPLADEVWKYAREYEVRRKSEF